MAEEQLARAARRGVNALVLGSPEYPPLLAAIPDPPPVLWVRGRADALPRFAVAIVGSRAATSHGLEMAARLSGDLARNGAVIVSGLARGIDSAAHAAALAAGGRTVGVLGCGIDRVYPLEHCDLAANMAHDGAVVSEFPSGVPPLPHHFPLRNRIISGLTRAVVVVEAGEKSGALITAGTALEQGRDVLVVPGAATGGRNRGGHLLIRDGARLVETAAEILQELGAPVAGSPQTRPLDQLPESAAFTVDDVAAEWGEPAAAVLTRLLELELEGHIQRVDGGRFVRVSGRPCSGPRVTV
jgi:DNA processing protein